MIALTRSRSQKGDLLLLAASLSERLKPDALFMSRRRPAMASATSSRPCPLDPQGPWHFPATTVRRTDRMVAAELTREQLYNRLHAELPYAARFETEKREDRKDGSTVIHHQILIERDSQKAIILGRGGAQLKAIARPRAKPSPSISAARSSVPARQGQPRWDETALPIATSGWSGRTRIRASSIQAGPVRRSADPTFVKEMLPWLVSRLISRQCAPQ